MQTNRRECYALVFRATNEYITVPTLCQVEKSILFLAATEGWRFYDHDVYRLDLETGVVERLTKKNGYATDLRVSADGKTAAFLKWSSDRHATPSRVSSVCSTSKAATSLP
jgi:Tol biopolymer transport system component